MTTFDNGANAQARETPRAQVALRGRRVVVTGGARGLGKAFVTGLLAAGAKVVVTHNKTALDKNAWPRAGESWIALQGDVRDAAFAKRVCRSATEQFGGIDALVYNAGTMQLLPLGLLEEEDWDTVMDTNVKGAYLFARAALKSMIKQKAGRLLFIGSFGADRAVDAPVHYAASKAALNGFAQALSREVGRYGISVNVLAPGLLDTGMAERLPAHRQQEYIEQCALLRTGRAEEIARMGAFLLSDDAALLTGAQVVVDGGLG